MSEPRTVLIVDDSEADQFLSRRVILQFDPTIEVLQAYDGREALDLLAALETPPHAVFLDVNMPVMNGYEFLEEYSQRDSHSAVVVMLTSSNMARDRERSRAFACVTGYYSKPLSVEAVSETLGEVIAPPR